MTAKTNAERQAEFRARNSALGRSELRGIFATKEEQAKLKKEVKILLAKMRK